jgi:hypothetical protein
MDKNHNHLDEIEDELKKKDQRKPKQKQSGKSVFKLKEIIIEKSKTKKDKENEELE